MATVINLNNTTPAAASGRQNVEWQADTSAPRKVSASPKDATTSLQGAVRLAGDFGGVATGPTVVGIQGTAVIATAPTDGQVLTYVAADTKWEPKPLAISQSLQFMAANNQGGSAVSGFSYDASMTSVPAAFTGTHVNLGYLPFVKATLLEIQASFNLTKDFVLNSNVSFDVVWTSPGGTGNVVWGINPAFVAPGASIDATYLGPAASVASAVTSGANNLVFSTITLTGPSTTSNHMLFKLSRLVSDAGDTFTGEARLLYIIATFKRYA